MKDDNVPTVLEGWDADEWAREIISLTKNPAKAKANAEKGIMLAEKYSQPNRAWAMEKLLTRLVDL